MRDSQEEIDEIARQVEAEAELQKMESAQDQENEEVKSEETREREAVEAANEESHTLILTKTYNYDGKKIDRIDFDALNDLTTIDLEYADRIIARMQHSPEDKFTDILWNRMIATRATGLSSDFFKMLGSRDMLAVVSVIRRYFLLGWE